ncbi:hypothetical protein [Vibrio salinus]|uniref:hypothetical protein n=1 Tax=Vibrio salinus TaxID=2899784 RepID=UPI001E301730|nr:hypothetical protein [Vibrio salinus]MCE0492626.1 hypothetical protein [Vibrio salinus]
MKKNKKIIFASCIAILSGSYSFSAFSAFSAYSKFYSHYEAGKCSDNSTGINISENMVKNAISYARIWCKGFGKTAQGAKKQDYNVETEGNAPYFCRVEGYIECSKS